MAGRSLRTRGEPLLRQLWSCARLSRPQLLARIGGALAALLVAGEARAADKVILQLRWDHQFQFAGFYAALWQGYYEEAGIEVEIRSGVRPDGSVVDVVEEVASGRADFGIGAADVLLARAQGRPVLVLATILQDSPVAFYALASTPLRTAADLLRLRVACNPGSASDIELRAMLRAQGLDPAKLNTVPLQAGAAQLRNGEADVVCGYRTGLPYRLKQMGLEFRELLPENFGVAFYGDSIFAHARLTINRPELARRFTEASLRGWRHAIAHRHEIAEQIARDLPQVVPLRDARSYNLAQADSIVRLVFADSQPVGQIDPERWQRMHEALVQLGLAQQPLNLDAFIFDPIRRAAQRQSAIDRAIRVGAMALVLLIMVTTAWAWSLRAVARRAVRAQRQQEERYRQLIERFPDAALVHREGHIVLANPRAAELLAASAPEELVGRDLYEMVMPEHRGRARDQDRRAIADNTASPATLLQMTALDGRVLEVEVTSAAVPFGAEIFAQVCLRDAGRHSQTEAALAESAARLKAIVDTAVDAILTIDESGTIGFANPATTRLFGFALDELLGRNVSMLMPEPYRSMHDSYLANYLRTGEARVIGIGREIEGRRKDGSTFPMELAVSEVRFRDRLLFTGFVHDVSERRQATLAIERHNRELQALNAELDQFASIAAHDLRAPLRHISLLTSWIEEGLGSDIRPEIQDHLRQVRERAGKMSALIDGLRQYSRAGQQDFPVGPVDLRALVRNIVELLALPSSFRVEVDADPPILEAAEPALAMVLRNLISNAVKHHDHDEGTIRISARRHGHTFEIAIEDDGPGIPERVRTRVFDMFASFGPDLKPAGDGVGLALVRRVVLAQGGRIWVEFGEERRGTTVRFTWPERRAAAA